MNAYPTSYYVWFPSLGETQETAQEITCEDPFQAAYDAAGKIADRYKDADIVWPQQCCVFGPEFNVDKMYMVEQRMIPHYVITPLR